MKYTPNHAGVAEILVGAPMVAKMAEVAEEIKTVAIALSPEETGLYRSSFVVHSGVKFLPGLDVRAYAEVENTAPYALHVEYGDGNTPRHRVLGRALGVA